ncbi:hypothetical protein LUX12_18955 [Streptomyces somaliensis]|uniref:hypothetical protein n=1 Tax=Streptomyces somaliensis TaxID=78355 RepID=UPI0020CD0EB1|nr:hypothetical protein [Streptomyces somaliensis]MCP9946399.1 hypothetical protein [Streptomyces somaliensis]MCP9960449.1 hypothetical protein [Streptomyces somaliensis]
MQTSAVPDLAHTHARPAHWLATAAATAGVIVLAGLAQPDPATATGPAAAPRVPVTGASAPDAAAASYPLECAGAPTAVPRAASGDLDGDGRPETVAAVHCRAGSGTPPQGLYVLTRASGAAEGARVVATLVDPADALFVGDLAVRDGLVTATLFGYSSPDVPRCCPDERETAEWRWSGGAFLRTTATTR